MKKTGRLKQLMALVLAGALTVGSVGIPVFGADFGDTVVESAVEDEALDEDVSDGAAVEESDAGAVAEDMDVPEENENNEDNNVETYTITLDANGGYFENEWDDAVGDYVERVEVIEKKIPVGGTVAAVPVFSDQVGQIMLFAGWSFEPGGELVSEAEEEYVPVDNCVLFAVWQAADENAGAADTAQETDAAEESEGSEEIEETEPAQQYNDVETAEENESGSEDTDKTETSQEIGETAVEADTAQEYEDTEKAESAQEFAETAEEVDTAQETAEDTNADSDETPEPVAETPAEDEMDITAPAETETVKTDAKGAGNENNSDVNRNEIVSFQGHRYQLFEVSKTWKEAKEYCESIGGHLATITTEEEKSFIAGLCTTPRTNYWIGGTDEGEEGNWRWITGEKWEYTNWHNGEPGNAQSETGIGEDYLQVSVDWGHTWNDSANKQDDTAAIVFICEWDNSGLWMTIFSNKNDVIDGGHAFLNIENESNEDVYIGNYKLPAGDNVYISGRGISPFDSHVEQSSGGIFYNYEGVADLSYSKDKGYNYYRDFAWYTVGIEKEDLSKLYSRIRAYGTYNFLHNNCCHFATGAWNAIVDEKDKVPSLGVPGTVKNYILDTLHGQSATELKLDDKDITDVLLLDSNGDFMPYTLKNSTYLQGINSLKVLKSTSTSVTLGWTSPATAYTSNKYNLTKICVEYTDNKGNTKTTNTGPASTGITFTNIEPGTYYSFKIYGVSDHSSTKAGIVTGEKSTKKCEVTTEKASQSITASNLTLTFPKSGTISVSGNKGKLTYKSSNTAVATVDSAGKVTAKGAGTAKITITAAATDNYNQATKTVTVTVNKAAQSITVKAAASSVAVGKTTTVSLTGNKGSKSFKSSDTSIATVSSAGKVTARKVGTVKITATSAANANYNAASKTVTIKVVPAATASLTAANQATGIKLTWKKVTGANGYKVYRGSTLIKTITSGSTVTYADTKANTNGTKYTYKVVAKASTGDSTLSKSVAVYRVARPAISSATNSAASKMTVKWGKNAKANGYQIQYSTDKTFKSGNKAVTVTSASTVSKVIGSLTKGKTYYVRIRTYKTVGSAKYWSVWSSARSVKISK